MTAYQGEEMSKEKAALYIRLSKEDERNSESQSVTNQRSLLLSYIQKHHITAYQEYVDDGYSGTSFIRPAFCQMLADIEAKKVTLILTKDLSRLGRDYIQTGYYIEKYFPEKGVRYLSLLDGIDTGSDSVINDITPFKAILDDMYAKDISKKIKSVKRDKQRNGQFIGGKAPYGYKKHPIERNTIIVDEKAAEIVREIFLYAMQGISCRSIANKLNTEGVLTPSAYAGKEKGSRGYAEKWSAERISYMLKNQVYIGNMVQGRVQKISYKSKKCIRLTEGQWTVVENTHEPIISREVFDTVQTLLQSRKHTREKTYQYWLKGLVFCKECGKPLGVIHRSAANGQEYFYFVCRTYQRGSAAMCCTSHIFREEEIRFAVKQRILQFMEQTVLIKEYQAVLEQVKKEFYESEEKSKNERYKSRREWELLTKKMNQMYLEHLDGLLEKDDFIKLYEDLKQKRRSLEEQRRRESVFEKQREITSLSVTEWLQRFQDTISENRELLFALFSEITVSENWEIYFTYQFPMPKAVTKVPLAIPDVSRIEKKALKKLSQELKES